MEPIKTMTVRDLKEQMDREVFRYPDALITFGGGDLSFDSFKNQQYSKEKPDTPAIIQMRFRQAYTVTMDPELND